MESSSYKKKKYHYTELCFFITVAALWAIALFTVSGTPIQWIAEYWPVVLVSFFSAAVINATATGGGIVLLPTVSFFYELNIAQAIKLALSIQALGITSGALTWPRHFILWRYFFFACASSSTGMLAGTFLWTPSIDLTLGVFGFTAIALGIILLLEARYEPPGTATQQPVTTISHPVRFCGLCVIGGLITAWVSTGIGEIVALWLFFQARSRTGSCVATGVAVFAFCSILGIVLHAGLGDIHWHYLLFTSLGAITGGRVGANSGALLAAIEKKRNENPDSHQGSLANNPLKACAAFAILLNGAAILWL